MDILVVEDDELDRMAIKRHLAPLSDLNAVVRTAATLTEAAAEIAERRPDIAIVDLGLPDAFELASVHSTISILPDRPVIVLTGDTDEQRALEALEAGASDYLVKDEITPNALKRSIRYSIERKRGDLRVRQQADLLNRTNEAIVVCRPDGTITFFNDGAIRPAFPERGGAPGGDAAMSG